MPLQPSFQKLGNDIIQEDLKRLKSYRSLEQDIDIIFQEVNNAWIRYGMLRDEKDLIYKSSEEKLLFFKRRSPISSHNLSKKSGARLIYCIIKKEKYLPFLLFAAKEEPKYPLAECKRIIKKRIGFL